MINHGIRIENANNRTSETVVQEASSAMLMK